MRQWVSRVLSSACALRSRAEGWGQRGGSGRPRGPLPPPQSPSPAPLPSWPGCGPLGAAPRPPGPRWLPGSPPVPSPAGLPGLVGGMRGLGCGPAPPLMCQEVPTNPSMSPDHPPLTIPSNVTVQPSNVPACPRMFQGCPSTSPSYPSISQGCPTANPVSPSDVPVYPSASQHLPVCPSNISVYLKGVLGCSSVAYLVPATPQHILVSPSDIPAYPSDSSVMSQHGSAIPLVGDSSSSKALMVSQSLSRGPAQSHRLSTK